METLGRIIPRVVSAECRAGDSLRVTQQVTDRPRTRYDAHLLHSPLNQTFSRFKDLKMKERTGYQELLTAQDVQKRSNRYKGNSRSRATTSSLNTERKPWEKESSPGPAGVEE